MGGGGGFTDLVRIFRRVSSDIHNKRIICVQRDQRTGVRIHSGITDLAVVQRLCFLFQSDRDFSGSVFVLFP